MVNPALARKPRKPAAKPAGPGRPKDMGKHSAILEAAKRMFAREGFENVSMDKIAAEAGVSKLTVYSHFGDKEALFVASVRARCQEMLPDDLFDVDLKGPLQSQLMAIATAFFGLISSEEALITHRMMLAPGKADDPLRRLFWEAGPQRTQEVFSTFLQARVDIGEMDIPDIPLASEQFFSLIKGGVYSRMMCGLCRKPQRDEAASHIEASVDMFLRAYASR